MNLSKNSFRTIAVIGWLCFGTAFAAPSGDFQAANQLYDAGKFAEAAAAYEKIEPKTAHAYYNLGNALFRDGKLGPALLNYERARRLAPRDPDILANLKFVEQRLGVDEVNTPPRAVQRLLRSAIESRTSSEWSANELVALWLAALAVGICVFVPKVRTGFIFIAVACLMGFAVSTFALSYEVIDFRVAPRAIVVTTETEARFAPVADSTVHFKLAEGTKVAIREDRGQWLFVERADGQQGWVKSDVVSRIADL
jgi:tetratricopeptide (TPR) repeat protein